MRAAGRGIGGEGRRDRIRRLVAAQPAQQARGNDQRAAEHDGRAVDDVAHGLEFLLAVLQAAFEIGDGAAGVFEVETHVFAGLAVLLELHPTVRPEVDLLGQALVDGGEGLVHMGDAAVGDLAEVLRDERRGGESEGPLLLVGANPRRVEQVLRAASASARASGSRSRCGAQPANAGVAVGRRRGRTAAAWRGRVPSPDLISWVSRKSSERLVALVGRVDEDGALAEQVARAARGSCR